MPRITDALARLMPRWSTPFARTAGEEKASRTGALIAIETLGRPVWTPRDYSAFAREGFMQNAIVYRCVRIPDTAARDIYHARYWQPASCRELPRGLSLMHFDAVVNHGVGTANRFLQEALGVVADGEIGPNTLAAVASGSVTDVLNRYAAIRRKRYRSLNHFWRFGRGWLARVDATLAAANRERAKKFPPTMKGPTPMPVSSMSDATVPATSGKPKWWGDSITIWGAMISALATVVPVLASAAGLTLTLTPDLVRDFGTHAAAVVQAVVALTGTIVTIYGRLRATQPLERRAVSLKI